MKRTRLEERSAPQLPADVWGLVAERIIAADESATLYAFLASHRAALAYAQPLLSVWVQREAHCADFPFSFENDEDEEVALVQWLCAVSSETTGMDARRAVAVLHLARLHRRCLYARTEEGHWRDKLRQGGRIVPTTPLSRVFFTRTDPPPEEEFGCALLPLTQLPGLSVVHGLVAPTLLLMRERWSRDLPTQCTDATMSPVAWMARFGDESRERIHEQAEHLRLCDTRYLAYREMGAHLEHCEPRDDDRFIDAIILGEYPHHRLASGENPAPRWFTDHLYAVDEPAHIDLALRLRAAEHDNYVYLRSAAFRVT